MGETGLLNHEARDLTQRAIGRRVYADARRAIPDQAFVVKAFLTLIASIAASLLFGALLSTATAASSVGWDRPIEFGCHQELKEDQLPSFKVKTATDPATSDGHAVVACADERHSRLIYALYSPGRGIIDRASVAWPVLASMREKPCCGAGYDFGVARLRGRTFLAYTRTDGSIGVAERREGHGWRLRTLALEPGRSARNLSLVAGKAGIYLTWTEQGCEFPTTWPGRKSKRSSTSKRCITETVRIARIDVRRFQPRTLIAPTERIVVPSLTVTKRGAYVAVVEKCAVRPVCSTVPPSYQRNKTISVYEVRNDLVRDVTPTPLKHPGLVDDPILTQTEGGFQLIYERFKLRLRGTRKHGRHKGEPILRSSGSLYRIRHRKGRWASPHRIGGRSSVWNYLSVGSVLYNTYIEGGSRSNVKLKEYLGADEWTSSTVPQVSQADSLAGQGTNFYLGSFPSFVHGRTGRLPELEVSLAPRKPSARPILYAAITQNPKYAKTLKEVKISLGAYSNELDVRGGLATSERTAHKGFPVGQLKLTPVNGRPVALPIIARQGNFLLRAKGRRARNLARKLTIDVDSGRLWVRGLPRKRLKRISIKLDGRRGGLLRNPKKCEPVLFYGEITSRSSGKLHASKLVKLRCRK